MKQKLQSMGFNLNHFALIGAFVLFILGLTYAQEPVLLQNIVTLKFLRASDAVEQTNSVTAVEVPPVSQEAIDSIIEQKKEMMSLLDPNFGEGSVLGLSTEEQASVDELIKNESLAKIPINVVSQSVPNLEKYKNQVTLVESYYGSTVILSAISTKDPAAAQKAVPLLEGVIAELKGMPVPQQLARYHRLKLMHYAVLLNMANGLANGSNQDDKVAAGILFFQITDAMETERLELSKAYSYQL